MILTDEEIMQIDPDGLIEGFARAIEKAVLNKLHKQVKYEICFNMAAGSPNRKRIHNLIDSWVKEN